jgi:TolB-like protein
MKGMFSKKRVTVFLLSLFSAAALSAQSAVSLDDALKAGAKNIESNLKEGTVVAILNFSSASARLSDYVIQELMALLSDNGMVRVVDRENLDLIAAEMDFQYSGEVSDESMQSIGQKLGAQSIVTGSGENMSGYYRVRFRTINVETAEIQDQITLRVAQDRQLVRLLDAKNSTGMGNTKFFVGAKLGIGIGFHTIHDDFYEAFRVRGSNPNEKSGVGFPFSIYGGYRIFDRLAVQTGLDFMMNNKVETDGYDGYSFRMDATYSTLDIPILARYSILLAPVELDALGGLYVSFAISKLNLEGYSYSSYNGSSPASNATVGLTFGMSVGYKLGPGSVIGAVMFVNDFNPIVGEEIGGTKNVKANTRRSLNIMVGYQYSL